VESIRDPRTGWSRAWTGASKAAESMHVKCVNGSFEEWNANRVSEVVESSR